MTEALLAEGVNTTGLGLLKVNDLSKLSMDATDGGSGVYSTDWTGTSGSMSPSLMTEASSVEGVNATTEVVVEDLDDDLDMSLDGTGDCKLVSNAPVASEAPLNQEPTEICI